MSGSTGTPVIDATNNVMYLIAYVYTSNDARKENCMK